MSARKLVDLGWITFAALLIIASFHKLTDAESGTLGGMLLVLLLQTIILAFERDTSGKRGER